MARAPSGGPDDPTERVTVLLPESIVDRLREIAHSRKIGVSTLIRMLISASLERSP